MSHNLLSLFDLFEQHVLSGYPIECDFRSRSCGACGGLRMKQRKNPFQLNHDTDMLERFIPASPNAGRALPNSPIGGLARQE